MKNRHERAIEYLQKEINNRKILRKQAKSTIDVESVYKIIEKTLNDEINLIEYIELVVRRYK